MTEKELPLHRDIPAQYTWNAPRIFASESAWKQEFALVNASLPQAATYQGHLADSAARLAEALIARDEWLRRAQVLHVYATMSSKVDTGDQQAAAMSSRTRSLLSQLLAAYAFVEPEVLAIGSARLQEWLSVEPRLADYAHYFDDLFRKQRHVRSAEVEELLGMLADPFSSTEYTEHMLTNADFQFAPARSTSGEDFPMSQSVVDGYLVSPDREVRRTAWQSLAEEYLAHRHTLASNLSTSIKQNVLRMRARRHTSTLAATLFDNNIPTEVFHNLIAVFRKNLPTWHRYWAIRRKALGVDRLHYYDLWAPIATQPPAVPYEQAVEWICTGLAPLGEDYVRIVRQGCLQDRWVDVYPSQGKSSGAFSTGVKGMLPFIMTSYHDDLHGLSTLAHELGHSLHSYLSWENQPTICSEYSLFVAEVASNFHQAMVRGHLLRTKPDPQFQLALLEEAFGNFLRYLFIMPTLARFELEMHQRVERGEGLAAETMMQSMAELYAEGFGGQLSDDPQQLGIVWAMFDHLYADYYVFQYATGIAAANALARRILEGAPQAAENYLKFLKAGGSVYPLDALKIAGVDLTQPEPVEAGFEVLAGMVDRLEAIVGK